MKFTFGSSMFILMTIVAMSIISPAPLLASATTCVTGGLDQYLVSGYSCMSGNLVFSNFGFTSTASPTGISIPAASISVTPTVITGDEGLRFNSGWSTVSQSGGINSFQDTFITFTVSTFDHSSTLDDLSLFFNGAFSGTVTSSVTESYCLNAPLATCPPGSGGSIQVTNPPPVPNSFVFVTPVSSISIGKDINVSSGTLGSANISNVDQNFHNTSSVPEPASLGLLGIGLVLFGTIRRRRQV